MDIVENRDVIDEVDEVEEIKKVKDELVAHDNDIMDELELYPMRQQHEVDDICVLDAIHVIVEVVIIDETDESDFVVISVENMCDMQHEVVEALVVVIE